jgi:DNA-binding response OmpR family regulator
MDRKSSSPAADSPLLTKSALIVEDDEMMATLLRDYLASLGVEEITSAPDGDAAWRLVREQSFQLILLDWRLPGVSGLALFSRIRQLPDYSRSPICISSGLLTREDCFLLDEYPVTRLLAKPYTEEIFTQGIERLLIDSQWQEANVSRLEEIVAGIRAKDLSALSSLETMLRASPNPTPVAINTAKILRGHGLLREAEGLLRRALDKEAGSILTQSELGKVLHAQGRFAEAHVVLSKAQQLSPKNLGRLCLLGEIELATGDAELAAKHFKQALAIDGDDEKAKAGLVTAANVSAMPAEQRKSPELLRSMAGLMNITAISLVKKGQHEAAIKQYQAAFHFITSNDDRARIAFNLGLGYLRWKRLDDATLWFKKSLDFSGGTFDKARDYLGRLEKRGVGGRSPVTPSVDLAESITFDE